MPSKSSFFKSTHSRILLYILIPILLINNQMPSASCAIIPNPIQPVTLNKPFNTISNSQLTLRFSFDTDLSSIQYGQFIGVSLPENIQFSDYQLNFPMIGTVDQPKYTCQLKVKNTLSYKEYNVKSLLPSLLSNKERLNEQSTLYCQYIDNQKLVIQNNINDIFELIITFNIKFRPLYINYISLFISTDNSVDKIILDKSKVFSNIGQYSKLNQSNINNIPLVIDSHKTNILTGKCSIKENACNDLFPDNSFSIDLVFKVNQEIDLNQNYIIMKIPSNIKLGRLKITSYDIIQNDINMKALTTNDQGLQIAGGFEDNTLKIINVNEFLKKNRMFGISLSGLSALKGFSLREGNLELFVYRKNTYTIVSYFIKNIFIISRISINFYEESINAGLTGINHPEYWDLYQNAAWPLSFKFKFDNDISEGGFLLIQHANARLNYNQVNFIASTCDFSDNSKDLVSNEFGKRPICYPLRNDLNFKQDISDRTYLGSGIFFKIPNIVANELYTVTVWAFFDACNEGENDPTNKNNRNSKTYQYFKYTLFSSINTSQSNESRFDNQEILAQSSVLDSISPCWNSYIGDANILYNSVITYSDKWKDLLLLKEVTDFRLGQVSYSSCQDCFEKDVSKASEESFNTLYLYSSKRTSLNINSFLLLNIKININKEIKNPSAYLPGPWVVKNTQWEMITGKLQFQLSKSFFSIGDSNCFLSWANKNGSSISKYNEQYNLFKQQFDTEFKKNYISIEEKTIDLSQTYVQKENENIKQIPDSIPPIMRITSTTNIPNNDNRQYGKDWTYLLDSSINPLSQNDLDTLLGNNIYSLYYYSNCVRIQSPLPQTMKNLFTYFDLQIKWLSVTSDYPSGIVTKVIRLIKLYPEMGVFNDENKISNSNSNQIDFYYIKTLSYNKGVCLIEVNIKSIRDIYIPNESDTLVLFLGHTVLLETDYDDMSALYPVLFRNENSYDVFGLSSSYSISENNQYIKSKKNLFSAFFPNDISSSYVYYFGSLIYIPYLDKYDKLNKDLFFQVPIYCPLKENQLQVGYSNISAIGLTMNTNRSFGSNGKIIKFMSTASNKIIYKDTPDHDNDIYLNGYVCKYVNHYLDKYMNRLSFITNKPDFYNVDITKNKLLFFYTQEVNIKKESQIIFSKSSFNLKLQDYYLNLNLVSKQLSFFIYSKKYNFLLSSDSNFETFITRDDEVNVEKNFKETFIENVTLPNINKNSYVNTFDNLFGFSSILNKKNDNNTYLFSSLYYDKSSNDVISIFIDQPIPKAGINNNTLTYIPISNITISEFNDYDYYSKDPGAAIKLRFSYIFNILKEMMINLVSENFNRNTACSLINSEEKSVNKCLFDNQNKMTCVFPDFILKFTSFEVYCYNIYISSNENIFILDNYFISKGLSNYSFNDKHNNIYRSDPESLPRRYAYKNVKTMPSPSFINEAIIYSQVNHPTGIGIMTINVKFTRPLPINFIIRIEGALNKLLSSTNISINCNSNFYSEKDNENDYSIIKKCIHNINSINTNIKSFIEIHTKDILVSSNYQTKSNLSIKLWPVKQVLPSELNLLLSISLPYDEVENRLISLSPLRIAEVKVDNFTENQKKLIETQISTTHKVPGMLNSINFIFYLNDIYDMIQLKNINEISIFLPYSIFGNINNQVLCMNDISNYSCNLTVEGILNISISEIKDKILNISIRNIVIPDIVGKTLFFLITFNNVNPENGVRSNIFYFEEMFESPAYDRLEVKGNLLVKTEFSSSNPRDIIGTIKVSMMIDSLSENNFPVIIEDPYILIGFSSNFSIYLSKFDILISSRKLLPIGNLLYINWMNPITFEDKDSSFDFELEEVFSPAQIIPPNNASLLDFAIRNDNNNIVYRTFSNLYTDYGSELEFPIDNYILYSKGKQFLFDNTKLVVNIYIMNKDKESNNFIVYPGRYMRFRFKIENYEKDNLNKYVKTGISLKDKYFNLENNNYSISTVGNLSTDFALGTKCGTLAGNYILNFINEDLMNFYRLYPIMINLSIDEKIKIAVVHNTFKKDTDKTIFINSGFIDNISYQLLPDKNGNNFTAFEDINIQWTYKPSKDFPNTNFFVKDGMIKSKNDKGEPSEFGIMDYSFNGNLNFNVKVLNNSCSITSKTEIIFSVKSSQKSSSQPVLNSPKQLSDNILEYVSSPNEYIGNLNSLKFKYSPPDNSIYYMYCLLICQNSDFPLESLDFIKNNTSTNENFYYSLIKGSVTITFNNLIRGRSYKVKCLATTNDADETNRKRKEVEVNSFIKNEQEGVSENIMTASPQTSVCAYISIKKMDMKKKVEFMNSLINGCQNKLLSNNINNPGCIYCVTSSDKPLDASLTSFSVCNPERNSQPKIIEQSNEIIGGDDNKFPLCAIQDYSCKGNDLEKVNYINLFKSFLSNLANNQSIISIGESFVDDKSPDMTQLKIINLKNTSLKIYWTAKHTKNLICYWIFNNSNNKPLSDYEMLTCSEKFIKCGKMRVNEQGEYNEIQILSNLVPDIYSLWFYCRNDLPYSNLYSNITQVKGLKIIQALDGETTSEEISSEQINSSINTESNKNTISILTIDDWYIRFNVFYMILILFIIW